MGKLPTLILFILLCVAVSAGTTWYYHENHAVRIIALDTSEYVGHIRELYRKGEMDRDVMIREMEKITTIIKNRPKNTVVLTSDVVLSKNVKTIKLKWKGSK